MIFVDECIFPNKRGTLFCHMISDVSKAELHEFAERIGCKRSWLHSNPIPHYDLTESKRAAAVLNGAQEISSFDLVRKGREVYGYSK